LLTVVYRSVMHWRDGYLATFSSWHVVLTLATLIGSLDSVWMLWDRPAPFRHMFKGAGLIPGSVMFVGMVARTCLCWQLFVRLSSMALAKDGPRRIEGIVHDGETPRASPTAATTSGEHFISVTCRHILSAMGLILCTLAFVLLSWYGDNIQMLLQWVFIAGAGMAILLSLFVTGVQTSQFFTAFALLRSPRDQWHLILKACFLAAGATWCILSMYLERNDQNARNDRVTPTITLLLTISTSPSYFVSYSIEMWTNRGVAMAFFMCMLIGVISLAATELHHTVTNLHILVDFHHHSHTGGLIDQTSWSVLYSCLWNLANLSQRLYGDDAEADNAANNNATKQLIPSHDSAGDAS
jgi:hypothetical protein